MSTGSGGSLLVQYRWSAAQQVETEEGSIVGGNVVKDILWIAAVDCDTPAAGRQPFWRARGDSMVSSDQWVKGESPGEQQVSR